MSEWIEKSLGEVTSYIAKGIPPKYIEKLTENAIYVLNQKCNRDFAISYESARIHDLTKKRVADEKMLNVGDVLVNSTGEGTAGRIAQLWDIPYPTTTDGHMITLRPTEEVDPLYYGYAIKAQQALIESLAEGSTGQTEINRKRLQEEVIIAFPKDKDKQNCTAKILENIDKKITINNEINRNLQEQAVAIYKDMILDSAEELCSIGKLSDVAVITMGQSPKGDTYNEEGSGAVFYQGRGEFGWRFPTRRLFTTEPKRMATINDVLISVRAPVGDVNVAYEECCIGRGLGAIHSKDNHQSYVLYTVLSLKENFEVYNGEGTVFGSINRDGLNNMEIVIPPAKVRDSFEELVAPIDKMIKSNYEEIIRLTELRDTLLPKLMSGELDVSDLDI